MQTDIPSLARLERGQSSVRQRYRASILDEAKMICRADWLQRPDDASLLHLRGLLALEDQQIDFAIACLSRAVSLAPSISEYAADLGDAMSRRGRVADAAEVFRAALALAPYDARLLVGLGRTLVRQKRLSEAEAAYAKALRFRPDHADAQSELAGLLEARGASDDALAAYQRALRLMPDAPHAHERVGAAWLRRGDWQRALTHFQIGLRLSSGRSASLYCAIGDAQLRGGAVDDAVEAYRGALGVDRFNTRAANQLVCVLELLGRRAEAVDAWCQLGAALERHGKEREAGDAYDTALARKADCLRAMVARGWIHITFDEFEAATRLLEAALLIEPHHFMAHMGLVEVGGLTGDYERALHEFEWTEIAANKLRSYEQPRWDGSPLAGRTILLWEDAGFGDVIQRMRFISYLVSQDARIIVESSSTMAAIFERMPGVQRVVLSGTPLPPFDVHSPFSLLAGILRVPVARLAETVPYIPVSPDLTTRWQRRLSDSDDVSRPALASTTQASTRSAMRRPTIGLVWASRAAEHGKSAPLAAFGPLAKLSHARFVSLQVGPQTIELIAPPAGLHVEPLVDDSFTIEETAAVILNLDLVISVDTMVAHLAGALNVPVWILLTPRPEWRWMQVDGRSPWYPSMRLFRRSPEEGWSALLARVGDELAASFAEIEQSS